MNPKPRVNPNIVIGIVALLVGFSCLYWAYDRFTANPYSDLPKLFMPPAFNPPATGVVGPINTVFVGIAAWEYKTAASVVSQMPAASEIIEVDMGLATARIRVYGPMEQRRIIRR